MWCCTVAVVLNASCALNQTTTPSDFVDSVNEAQLKVQSGKLLSDMKVPEVEALRVRIT